MRRVPSTILAVVIVLSAVTVAATPAAAATSDAQGSECTFPYTATDTTGTKVTVEEAPDRVVVLQASDAQTMWEIGARDQVVAMPQNTYTSYLNDTEGRTNVANADGSTNVEAVVGSNPDLVLAANVTRASTIKKLRNAGITVYHFPLVESIEGIYNQTERIGRLTGNCAGANETVSGMRERVQQVRNAVADREQPRVLYYSYGYTTGNETHIHDLMETAGGQNIAAEAGLTGYKQISTELVVKQNPQWIVLQTGGPAPSGDAYNETTALEQNQTLRVNANYLSQPAPRVVIALETMATAFHSEAFQTPTATATPTETDVEGTDETATPTATATPTQTTETEHEHTETTSTSGPGFGPLAPLVAMGLALLVAARRKGT